MANPVASSMYGMLETPDLRCFGRSDQIHIALRAMWAFQEEEGRMPNAGDIEKCKELANKINSEAKEKEDLFSVEEIDQDVLKNTCSFAACSLSPMCAFYGGIVAQEIVKFTGKYHPMK